MENNKKHLCFLRACVFLCVCGMDKIESCALLFLHPRSCVNKSHTPSLRESELQPWDLERGLSCVLTLKSFARRKPKSSQVLSFSKSGRGTPLPLALDPYVFCLYGEVASRRGRTYFFNPRLGR